MIKVIPCGYDATSGDIPHEGDDLHIYGCGVIVPGFEFDEMLIAAAGGTLKGAAGILVPPDVHANYPVVVREKVGRILDLLPRVFVVDELSREWMLHLGHRAEVGGDPSWLVDEAGCDDNRDEVLFERLVVTSDISRAILAARRGCMLVLDVTKAGVPAAYSGSMKSEENPLVRWAAAVGCEDRLAFNKEELEELRGGARPFPISLVEEQQAKARLVLEHLDCFPKKQISMAEHLDRALGIVNGPPPAPEVEGTRKLEIGHAFDPATHYDDYYFGAGGQRLLYLDTDGKWHPYQATGDRWEGNAWVAKIIDRLMRHQAEAFATPTEETKPRKSPRLLDLGCGAGDFVGCMRRLGWQAWGLDISEKAFARASGDVRQYLVAGDLNDPTGVNFTGPVDVITSFDCWEHIWPDEADRLIHAIHGQLRPGGLHVACICTRGSAEKDWVLEKGCEITQYNSWLLVAGHVHIRDWMWWARRFTSCGFKVRHDLANLFNVLVASDPTMSTVRSWSPRNVFVVEKS